MTRLSIRWLPAMNLNLKNSRWVNFLGYNILGSSGSLNTVINLLYYVLRLKYSSNIIKYLNWDHYKKDNQNKMKIEINSIVFLVHHFSSPYGNTVVLWKLFEAFYMDS